MNTCQPSRLAEVHGLGAAATPPPLSPAATAGTLGAHQANCCSVARRYNLHHTADRWVRRMHGQEVRLGKRGRPAPAKTHVGGENKGAGVQQGASEQLCSICADIVSVIKSSNLVLHGPPCCLCPAASPP